MSAFDVAIGMQAEVLDRGAAELYADPQARAKLFKGTETGTLLGAPYVADWDVRAAPHFVLSAPDQTHWSQAVNAEGKRPGAGTAPLANTLQLCLPQLDVHFRQGTAPALEGTAPVEVYATVGVTADPASGGYLAQFVPVAVWLDESQMSAWDKAILNLIIGVVLRLATTMFKGWRLPALTFTQQVGDVSVGIALAEPPLVAVDQQRLIMAACLQSGGQAVDVRGAAWPPQPLFALVTPAVLQEAAGQASAQLKGHKVADSGNYKGVADWAYSATLDGLDVTLSPADLTQCTAHVRASFEATLKPLGLGGPCAISAAGRSLG